MQTVHTLGATLLLLASTLAQSTWVVDAGGGAGVHFADLPTAVAAAASGDTILVRTGPFGEGAAPFVTDKGLTIVGEGGHVPIHSTVGNPFVVSGLPAGSSFRMVGFAWGLGTGELNFTISNCAGKVHLERLSAREPGPFAPVWPAFQIHASVDVTLREIVNFGAPAVQIDGSRVLMVGCQLGRTAIGVGGGQAVRANYSTVDIVEPRFDTVTTQPAAIELFQCTTRLTGSAASYVIQHGGFGPFQPVVLANGGSLRYDPTLPLSNPPAGSLFSGTTPPVSASLPATFVSDAQPGSTMVLSTAAPVGSVVFPAIGTPGFLTATPLGTLGIDLSQPYGFLSAAVVPAGGVATTGLPLPLALPRGVAFAVQAVVAGGATLEMGLPCTFVVH